MTIPGLITAHVVSFPCSRAGRALGEMVGTHRLLAEMPGVRFAVVGRSSGGDGTRDVFYWSGFPAS